MSYPNLPKDCSKQWEILLLLLSAEEKKIDRTTENEIDTMNYFFNNEGVKKILSQWLAQMKLTYARKSSESDTALKCNQVSFYWRQKGNDKYHANSIEESFQCYCKSVIYAKQHEMEFALALANRSAALLRLKRYKECLADIALAIKHGYRRELMHRLLLRRADCYIELNKQSDAQASLLEAAQHAHSLKLSVTQTAEFERHIKMLEKKMLVLPPSDDDDQVVLPECHLGLNPNFKSASKAIDISYNDTMGRHVIAKESLQRGDVLFSEEPYAWVTLPSGEPTCEMCCQPDINPLPCTLCSRSIYCNEACRSQAYMTFHRYECVGAQSDLFRTIGIAHLALRVLLISAYNGFPQPPVPLPKQTASELFKSYGQVNKIEIYKQDQPDFYRMFNLVTNFEKMNNTDYIQYALTAIMLALYLENFTSFFDGFSTKVPCTLSDREQRLFVAAVLLRGMGQLVCNGHAALSLTTTSDDGSGRTVTEREVHRATAIYPSAAMMNHSCDPNIINTFYKNRLLIRCARTVPCGTAVLNCYGPHRARESTAARRAMLRAQYMFHCACTACADVERAYLFNAYACHSCKGPVTWHGKVAKCRQCHADFHPDKALAILDRADELALQAEGAASPEQRCERMHASYRLRQQVWHRHYTALRAAADRLARVYADAGEFSKSVELIKQNIQSLEYQFGSFSVEVAHELRKLSDVMLERIINSPRHTDYRNWCLETHKIVKKAVQLMEFNYGSWEPLVKRLKKQEALVASLVADTRTGDDADCIHHSVHYNLKI